MAGTFEIIFSGLCLFLLHGDGTEYTGMDVNLLKTSDTRTECKDEGTTIRLHEHLPRLIIPNLADGWAIECNKKKVNQACDFQQMGCRQPNKRGERTCMIKESEICIEAAETPAFEITAGRDGKENDPEPEDIRAFGWISHLGRLDGDEIARLKSEVTAPAKDNPLIAVRIHSSTGILSTDELGYQATKHDNEWIWRVKPDRQPGMPWNEDHPKALAETMQLQLDSDHIRVKKCGGNKDDYWWEFSRNGAVGSYRIRFQNHAKEDCGDECIVRQGRYPRRLRHFLWYYQLVEWENGTCPSYLTAPVCPDDSCDKKAIFQPGEPFEIRGDANHFCPPTTYP